MAQVCETEKPVALREQGHEPDWLTALLPTLFFSWVYYHWAAAALQVLAVGGYLMADRLLRPAESRWSRLQPALLTGLLTALFLPAGAPYWPAALAGALGAVVARVPAWIAGRWPASPLTRPLWQPALVSLLLLRAVFPGVMGAFSVPLLWQGLDSAPTVGGLLADATIPLSHLLLGIHNGPIGGTCELVVLLGVAYLLLRRRLRVLLPVCMLTTVALLSWMIWGSPVSGLLVGSTLLVALLAADMRYAPAPPADQAIVGVVAGGVTVLLRAFTGQTGVFFGVLAAGLLQPALPFIYRVCRLIGGWLRPVLVAGWRLLCRCARWLWPRVKRLCGKAWRVFWRLCQKAWKGFLHLCREICEKISKKSK